MKKKVVVIGGGAGGMTCAVQIRKNSKEAEITVIEKGKYVSWAGCPTPYYIAGELPFKSIVHYKPEYFKEELNIDVKTECKAEKIDFENKTIKLINKDGTEEIEYDTVVLSCGATPFVPEIENYSSDIEGIFKLSNAEDAENIKEFIKSKSPKKAVIAGAGFIGMEMMESFVKCNMDVIAIEKSSEILPFLSHKLKEPILNKIREKEIRVITGDSIVKIEKVSGENKINRAILESGEVVETELLLLSIGVKPNIELLKNSGYQFSENNRVVTDEKMMTYIKNVYAIGDMIYVKNSLKDIYEHVPLGDVADKQGLIAAANICGIEKSYKGVNGSGATSFFDIRIAKTGLNLKEAEKYGYKAKSLFLKAFTKLPGFSDSPKGEMEIIYDEEKGVVLGAFMTGHEAVAQFVDIFSIVIYKQIKIEEFIDFDFCYSPTNSTVWNPLLILYRKYMKEGE